MVLTLNIRKSYLENISYNTAIQCIFQEDCEVLTSHLDSKLMAIPNILNCFSVVTLLTGGVELFYAQMPYSMRGLVCGVLYGSTEKFALIGYGISLILILGIKSITWGTGLVTLWVLIFFVDFILLSNNDTLMFILGVLYKKRNREDVLPNEHIFAERYYANEYPGQNIKLLFNKQNALDNSNCCTQLIHTYIIALTQMYLSTTHYRYQNCVYSTLIIFI